MRIAVLCSGGDAPGMNACVRAVVRTAVTEGHDVVGIQRGYAGLLKEDLFHNTAGEPRMTMQSVFHWSQSGGAFLRSSRSDEFRAEDGLRKAAEVLNRLAIDALIPIGGDGTFRGAVALANHWSGQIVGCPGTIDNDLQGTDYTIGFSTAVQTAVEGVDKLRDTAESHERMFLVEVMGRHSGYIAVHTALATGAEVVCVPETSTDIQQIIEHVHKVRQRGKHSAIMIVAEGDEGGGAQTLNEQLLAANCPYSTRIVVLGHLQRGGNPTPEDRILGSHLGYAAVRSVADGSTGVMVGIVNGRPLLTPFPETYARHRPIPDYLLNLVASFER